MPIDITLEQIEQMSKDDYARMSGVKVLMCIFSLGKNGRKVDIHEMKAFSKDEREEFVTECREDFLENCKA